MESSSQRLVQPWSANEFTRRPAATTITGWPAWVGVVGAAVVLVLAALADALESRSASLGMAAATWGFLAAAHASRASLAPRFRELRPLIPLGVAGMFLALCYLLPELSIPGRPRPENSNLIPRQLGAWSGLIAFGIAIHLTVRQRSTIERLLVVIVVTGSVLACAVMVGRMFQLGPQAQGGSSIASFLDPFRFQPQLIAVALLGVCVSIGLYVQRLDQPGHSRSWMTLALLPLTLPLLASFVGACLTAAVIVGLLGHLMARWLLKKPSASPLFLLLGAVILTLTAVRIWYGLHFHGVAVWPAFLSDASGWSLALSHFGILNVVLLAAASLIYYLDARAERDSPLGCPLALWCYLGCLCVGALSLWAAPWPHPTVSLISIVLFVVAVRAPRFYGRPPGRSKNRRRVERQVSEAPIERTLPKANLPNSRTSATGFDGEGLGKERAEPLRNARLSRRPRGRRVRSRK